MRTIGLFTGAINNTIQRYNATRGVRSGIFTGEKIFHNTSVVLNATIGGLHLLILAGTSLWWWVGRCDALTFLLSLWSTTATRVFFSLY